MPKFRMITNRKRHGKESDIQSAYFWTQGAIDLMRQILRGHDRPIASSNAGIS